MKLNQKTTIKVIALAVLGASSVFASSVTDEVRAIYNSPTWQKAFAGYYGIDTNLTPQPKGEDIAKIKEIAEMVRDDALRSQAILILEQYRKSFGTPPEGKDLEYSALIDQIIGALYYQQASLAEDSTLQEQYRKKAIENLEIAVKRFPNYRQAHKNLANLYYQMQNQEKALEHFLASLKLGDVDALTYGILSSIYFEQGKFAAAESAARSSLMINPTEKSFRRILAFSLLQQQRFEEARAVLEELVEETPNDTNLWEAIANTYISTEQITEAARILEIVRLMDAGSPQSLQILGDVYINQDMVEDAAKAYNEALQLASKKGGNLPSVSNFIRPAETLTNFQAFDLAIELLDEVQKVYSGKIEKEELNNLLALRAQIEIARGNAELAAENLNKILDNDPFNGRALLGISEYWVNKARDAASANDNVEKERCIQRAIGYFERAEKLITTGEEGEEIARQAYVGKGQLLAVVARRYKEAIEAFEKAQAIKHEDRIAGHIDMIKAVTRPR